MNYPITWTIAGSDSGGGAGIQADLHTFHSFAVYGCSVITSVTAQNSHSVENIHNVPAEHIAAQIHALKIDLPAVAIKLGMLSDVDTISAVAEFLQNYTGFVVLDPVMVATSGNPLFQGEMRDYAVKLQKLFAMTTVVTPNLHEAEVIVGRSLQHHEDIKNAAIEILAMGAKSVLIKGGHFDDDLYSQDYWTDGIEAFWLAGERQQGHSYHGAGCTLSSAITAALALGHDINDALVMAKMYVSHGIRTARQLGQGRALPVAHAPWIEHPADLPLLSHQAIQHSPKPFLDCGVQPLGLYPLVDRADWLERLLPLGISTIQLRIKDLHDAALEQEVQKAVAIAERYQARLFINDYWQLAIKYRAYGVHLGQEDLSTADVQHIHAAGLRLGLSTHSYYELARAYTHRPSYLAFGPVFPTNSKVTVCGPQGVEKLKRWRRMVHCPLVAIGGINFANLAEILAAGVDGVAVIAVITKAQDPEEVALKMLAIM